MKILKDKVAVVTGAGSGIGRATAIALGKEGCHLALADINQAGMEATAGDVEGSGVRTSQHKVDVASRKDMERFVEEVIEHHGHVHIIVNNAGVSVFADFIEQSIEDMEWVLGINLWGVIYGCKFFLPHLRKEEEGHIVNISSSSGIFPTPKMSIYTTSKFAVRGLSETIRTELTKYHIGVTSVHPGMIRTNIPHATKYQEKDKKKQETGAAMFSRFGHPPEKAARKIVKGIKNNSQRVLIGPEAYVFDILKRAFPVGSDYLNGQLSRMVDIEP
jgi:NAD(P)-dependent dehydrogenase (short-subunit alcohol dehydrogenase family)